MKKNLPVLAFSLLLAACGETGSNPQPPAQTLPAASAAASGAELVFAAGKGPISEERTTAFKSFMPTWSGMGKVVNGEDAYDVEKFKAAAQQFVEEARVPFEYFQNDPKGNGDALPPVWQQPEAFQEEQDRFLAAVGKLNEAAQSGNLEAVKAAYGEAGASCKSCHQSYRRPK